MAKENKTKFAVLGLSDALREELAPAGVGVSTLFPGLTRSVVAAARLRTTGVAQPKEVWAWRTLRTAKV